MEAKEIIAQAIETAYGPTLGRTIPLCVLEALHAAGYRIIHDSENHGPTLERAAHIARGIGCNFSASYRAGAEDAATAIRAMEVKNNG